MSMVNKFIKTVIVGALAFTSLNAEDSNNFVPIIPGVKSLDITLNGKTFTLQRNQDMKNKISDLYNITARGVPQPIVLAKGVETIGELEFIDYMKKAQKDSNIAIIDTRTPGWYAKLRIPGAKNVPYTNFNDKYDAIDALEDYMGVVYKDDGSLDFSNAKTLVLYCNGYWCGQTPGMIKNAKYSLLTLGYPVDKIKYYRGGMQAWTSLGYTVAGSAAKN
ncbi:rhodanese-like domain-containing protein [Arcobacter sp. CECT 8985]|uniref:rhodanese-like domain-containing protein n=1 Tax=Arcobacter sp. CECT 8985 TaxID=1935424 RepID=UPI00100B0F3F|nr:rhodanese-like domain-containing protein [Arcobacter sp. CECT 8985]RXJ84027.1 sulfurtransferase [Arcobacter sp. CECT 8985]